MLHCAKASTKLSEAVIRAFGSRVKILNFYRSRRLSEWVPVLRKHIKAFSLSGLPALRNDDSEGRRKFRHKSIVETLKALCTTGVALEALNLEGLGATEPGREEEVAKHVIKAIQQSRLSLKEIAFHINLASAMTMPHVTLPNLEMAQVTADDEYGEEPFEESKILSDAKVFGIILQGINGQANRSSNISTLRELRLYNLLEPPVLPKGCCSGLFHAVRKLIIMCSNNSRSSEMASFIANFWNLSNLEWFTGFIAPEDMDVIFGGSPNLQKISISTSRGTLLFMEGDLTENTPRLRDLFISFRGKQRKLELLSYMSFQQIKILAENSPNLRVLETLVDADNVGALSVLLGTHCRHMRELRLLYSREATDCLDRDGWAALAQGICSASDELCVLTFVGDRKGPMIERAANEMVDAINKILEFMGDRARCIVFRVPIDTHNPFTVLDAISRTLNTGKIHCRFIETLCADFVQHHSLARYMVETDADEDRLMASVSAVTDLQKSFFAPESRNKVDIGDVDVLWELQHWMEGLEGNFGQELEHLPA